MKATRGLFKKRGVYQIYVPGRTGCRQRSTGTSNELLAKEIKRMVESLRNDQHWDVLQPVFDGRLSLERLYGHYAGDARNRERRLQELAAALNASDLGDYLDRWVAWYAARKRRPTSTIQTYRSQVETLVTAGFKSSDLTPQRVSLWLTSLNGLTSGTRAKYLGALRSFVAYLLEAGVIETDPTSQVRAPEKNGPRERWETEENDLAIVNAAPAEYRAIFAFIKATGADVSAALDARWIDFDLTQALARIRGTKTATRDRPDVIIEPWAVAYLRAHFASRRPTSGGELDLVWPGLSRYQLHWHHQSTCEDLSIIDYTLRDARHSWAVRARKRGESLEAIAAQLGHKNIHQAVTCYARYKPTIEERRQTQFPAPTATQTATLAPPAPVTAPSSPVQGYVS